MKKLLEQLLTEVRAAGATTFELLPRLDPTTEAYHFVNGADSTLSAWEDEIEKLISQVEVTNT